MPKYDLVCEMCGARRSRVLRSVLKKYSTEAQAAIRACLNPPCQGNQMVIDVNPSTQVVETLDNGLMTRKVERLADAERLFKERAASDPRNQK